MSSRIIIENSGVEEIPKIRNAPEIIIRYNPMFLTGLANSVFVVTHY